MKCEKCGHEIPEESSFCNKCGNRIIYELAQTENEDIQENEYKEDVVYRRSRKKVTLSVVLLAIITIIGVGGGGWLYSIKLAESEYNKNLRLVVEDMIVISTEAENIIDDYIRTWKFAIDNSGKRFYIVARANENITLHEFNDESIKERMGDGTVKVNAKGASNPTDAITIVYNKYNTEGKINEIRFGKEKIKEQMKALNKPKKGYESAFETTLQMYSLFEEFISLATDPSGSYNSYTTKANDLTDGIIQKKSEFDVRLPN